LTRAHAASYSLGMIIQRLIGSALTLYMLAICVRWLGAYVEVEMDSPHLRHVARATDPFINFMRGLVKSIGSLGPMDWGPIAALLALWVVRMVFAGY